MARTVFVFSGGETFLHHMRLSTGFLVFRIPLTTGGSTLGSERLSRLLLSIRNKSYLIYESH